MTHRIFDNGTLLEEWDDEARIYRRFVTEPVEQPYSARELAELAERLGRPPRDTRP